MSDGSKATYASISNFKIKEMLRFFFIKRGESEDDDAECLFCSNKFSEKLKEKEWAQFTQCHR